VASIERPAVSATGAATSRRKPAEARAIVVAAKWLLVGGHAVPRLRLRLRREAHDVAALLEEAEEVKEVLARPSARQAEDDVVRATQGRVAATDAGYRALTAPIHTLFSMLPNLVAFILREAIVAIDVII
jgi:hypothetical protein